MNEQGDSEPEPDDAAERRKRADQLHEEIERLKSGQPDQPERPKSPREFTEPGQRNHQEDEAAESDDGGT
jgi:hypothetical protein